MDASLYEYYLVFIAITLSLEFGRTVYAGRDAGTGGRVNGSSLGAGTGLGGGVTTCLA